MKFIIAIIKPSELDEVREALSAINVGGLTVTEVKGFGHPKSQTEVYLGAEFVVYFLPEIKLEIAIADDQLDQTIEAIEQVTRTGEIDHGQIFVFELEYAVRIRTGETGEAAI